MAANPVVPFAELRLESRSKMTEAAIRATGRLTLATSPALERTVRDLIPKFKRIVLDLSNVRYIDCSGVGALANVYLQARKANCELEIDNPKPRLRDRLRDWMESALAGHEEYLGMTPD